MHGSDIQPPERRGKHPVTGRFATSPRKQEIAVSMPVGLVKHTEGGAAQRYPMFTARFHPLGGNGPHSGLAVDFRSGSKPDFGGSSSSECQELDGQPSRDGYT